MERAAMKNDGRASEAAEEQTLDDVVRDAMAEWHIPGVTVAILHDGEVETHGYGVVSLETHYPTRPDTLFQVGSNSKVFTATLVMRLVEEGVLDLDTPVGTYLPDLVLADPTAAATITLRHLLSHTSGLEGDRFEDTGEGDDALARYVAGAGDWNQETAPGEFWSYCNSGFGIAGRIIEEVTGTTFETAMKERVFVPLGLERSFYFAHEAIIYSAAAGHEQLPGEKAPHVARPYHIGRRAHAAGGIIASAGDLLAFLRFHLGDGVVNGERVLTRASIRAMQEPQVEIDDEQAWGIGWGLRTIDGTRVIEHGGGTNGHITQMLAVPKQQFGLVILTNGNRGGHVNEAVEKWALARYCGLREREPEQSSLPADQLERLTGAYSQRLQTATVALHDGELTMTVVGNNPFSGETIEYPPIPLAPLGEWELIATGGDWEGSRMRFIPGDDGRPRFVRLGGRLAPRQPDAGSA
jgi:CubicO group peptidase (beta-lactamase class C family)